MMTRIVACQPEELRIGRAVRVRFEPWADDTPMPVFALQDDLPGSPPEQAPQHAPGDRSRAGAVSAADMPAAEPTARR